MLADVFSVVAPIFIVAAIGYFWVRLKQPFDNETISNLVMMVGSPCLIFASLTANPPSSQALTSMLLAGAMAITLSGIAGYLVSRLMGWHFATYTPSLMHQNAGNMGLPLVLLAFGEQGLALGVALFFVNSISQFTLGIAIASGKLDPWALFRQPIIFAVLAVLLVNFTGLTPPVWVVSTTELLGGLTIPAMLLMLGTSIARLQMSALGETFIVATLRLLFGFGFGHLIVWVLDLSGIVAGVVILQCTMPPAVFNYVFADRFDREPEKVAAVVLQGTVLSFLTLPLLVGYVLAFNS